MSTYLVSDIHGCYKEFQKLLEEINLSDEDDLYVLGDAVDRGPEPINVLLDLMDRPNVTYILGNHDFCMYSILKRLAVEITDANYGSHLTEDDLLAYQLGYRMVAK